MKIESVWDYPRPPAVESSDRRIRAILNGVTIVDTVEAIRVLETSHPPSFYVPEAAVAGCDLIPNSRRTRCEFKGVAYYWDLRVGDRLVPAAAWSYPNPATGYEAIAGYLSFYPGRLDECWVDEDRVTPQPGDFYGGWITPGIEGPFKRG